MPQPGLPLTPASSLDLKGQDGTLTTSLQVAFELPPPALNESKSSTSPKSPSAAAPASRRRAASATSKASFTLPPPPTRSRKIIQMKLPEPAPVDEPPPASTGKPKTAAEKGTSKKKQPSATSAAGRKIARKTAHSLIERRRRSKMNEEFGTLKSLIPACTGEMHKLAILQASIDYVRYLEDCVSKLKAQNTNNSAETPTQPEHHIPSNAIPSFKPSQDTRATSVDSDDEDDEDHDVQMENSEATSPAFTSAPQSHQPSVSPALLPQDHPSPLQQPQQLRDRQGSYSSVSTVSYSHHRHYSYSTSAGTSPAFGPQQGSSHPGTSFFDYARSSQGPLPGVFSALTSPALLPLKDRDTRDRDLENQQDQEATAALLMLNTDRRGTMPPVVKESGRGMSVMDLLSS